MSDEIRNKDDAKGRVKEAAGARFSTLPYGPSERQAIDLFEPERPAGGTAVFIGLFLIYAALSFFTLEGLEFMNCLTDGAREFAAYPLDVYGKDVLKFCTCVVPYALFQYYPLTVLLGRSDRALYACMPLLSIAFLAPCLLLWRVGVHRYKSAGS